MLNLKLWIPEFLICSSISHSRQQVLTIQVCTVDWEIIQKYSLLVFIFQWAQKHLIFWGTACGGVGDGVHYAITQNFRNEASLTFQSASLIHHSDI